MSARALREFACLGFCCDGKRRHSCRSRTDVLISRIFLGCGRSIQTTQPLLVRVHDAAGYLLFCCVGTTYLSSFCSFCLWPGSERVQVLAKYQPVWPRISALVVALPEKAIVGAVRAAGNATAIPLWASRLPG